MHSSTVEIDTAVHRFPPITRILTECSSQHLGSDPTPAFERGFVEQHTLRDLHTHVIHNKTAGIHAKAVMSLPLGVVSENP